MSVLKYDLTLNAGETREISLTIKDNNSLPITLTGVTVDAAVVDYIGCTENTVVFSSNVDEEGGIVILTLPVIESTKLQNFSTNGDHYWNVFFNYPDGRRKKRIDGKVKVKKAAR